MRDSHALRILLLLLCAIGVATDAHAGFTTIKITGAKYLRATGINNSGTSTGWFLQCVTQPAKWPRCRSTSFNSFIRTSDGSISIISANGGLFAAAINDNGDIAGHYDQTGCQCAFLRTADGTITTFAPPRASYTWATGINANDAVVGGFCETCDGEDDEGFVRTSNGTITVLGSSFPYISEATGINSSGVVVGWFTDDQGEHGYTYSPDGTFTTIDAPGTTGGTAALGINSNGDVVGTDGTCFVRYADGTFWTITSLNSTCYPTGINDSDEIAGTAGSNVEGFEVTSDQTTTFQEGTGLYVSSGPNSSGAVAGQFWQPGRRGKLQYYGFIWQPSCQGKIIKCRKF